ncbi:hypothetical protein [Streptomyces sp. YS415]|uniref:hypothetical protein n=1 Tax=Streptomyces sp. YS415 TaxID=2944806 RepID=UPI002020A986|nr:hypothetical protein [Streptomyces sp. YS415]MCL7429389.1 hypothetical protein [Streptomyces sp. YS415]
MHDGLFARLTVMDPAGAQDVAPRDLARRDALLDDILLDDDGAGLTVPLLPGGSPSRRREPKDPPVPGALPAGNSSGR